MTDISIHALRGEGDTGRRFQRQNPARISIHALRGEGDSTWAAAVQRVGISIHALRGEGDAARPTTISTAKNFNPRPPWGGRLRLRRCDIKRGHISIHALRGEGDLGDNRAAYYLNISIHALRGEGDKNPETVIYQRFHFNPRPPWGGRHRPSGRRSQTRKFQSTPSVGRATRGSAGDNKRDADFNPRPPWGGRLCLHHRRTPIFYFNPRPPWGGRQKQRKLIGCYATFQSTPSVGRATSIPAKTFVFCTISIHALRGEGDHVGAVQLRQTVISIHALRGEGDSKKSAQRRRRTRFQSTPSVGRATAIFSAMPEKSP